MMLNPFTEKFNGVIEYAKTQVGLSTKQVRDLLEEVAVRCLEIGCKGKMLKRLVDGYPSLKNTLATVVIEKYRLDLDDLPNHEDEDACRVYQARLCRDYFFPKSGGVQESAGVQGEDGEDMAVRDGDEEGDEEEEELDELSYGDESHEDGPELVSYPTRSWDNN